MQAKVSDKEFPLLSIPIVRLNADTATCGDNKKNKQKKVEKDKRRVRIACVKTAATKKHFGLDDVDQT